MMDKNNALCLFVGVPLSQRTVRALSMAASELRKRADAEGNSHFRWVPPARYHVTLKYIGWTRPELVPAIVDTVSTALAGHSAFDVRCRKLGAFPSLDACEVLWAGVDERGGELTAIAKKIDFALGELGIPRESQPFCPHVTIARLRPSTNLLSFVHDESDHMFSKSCLQHLILYKSDLKSELSGYENLHRWSFE